MHLFQLLHCSYVPFVTDFHALGQLVTLNSFYRHCDIVVLEFPVRQNGKRSQTDISNLFSTGSLIKGRHLKKKKQHRTKLEVNKHCNKIRYLSAKLKRMRDQFVGLRPSSSCCLDLSLSTGDTPLRKVDAVVQTSRNCTNTLNNGKMVPRYLLFSTVKCNK